MERTWPCAMVAASCKGVFLAVVCALIVKFAWDTTTEPITLPDGVAPDRHGYFRRDTGSSVQKPLFGQR